MMDKVKQAFPVSCLLQSPAVSSELTGQMSPLVKETCTVFGNGEVVIEVCAIILVITTLDNQTTNFNYLLIVCLQFVIALFSVCLLAALEP